MKLFFQTILGTKSAVVSNAIQSALYLAGAWRGKDRETANKK
jgi:hypothetical protein